MTFTAALRLAIRSELSDDGAAAILRTINKQHRLRENDGKIDATNDRAGEVIVATM